MLYESYQRKVLKVASFLKKVLKHIVLISVSASVLVLAGITLLITKGIITSEGTCPEKIAYGEEASFPASAFMSSVEYEYSANGDSWSSEMPKRSGKYLVRAVSAASFGTKKYSEAQSFELLPKEITVSIKEDGLIHGQELTPYAELIGDDRIAQAEVSVVVEHSAYRKTVCFDKDSIKIVDKNGKDVTYSYKITTEEKTVYTSRRDITVEIPDKEKVYDGEELTSDEYIIAEGSLAEGDRLTLEFSAAITNVGSVKNTPHITVKNSLGEDVTILYNLSCISGTLTVTKRPISLTTADESYIYSGSVPTPDRYTLETEQLLDGHSATVLSSLVDKNAGKHENSMTLVISDKDGNDVTSNYDIDYNFGTVTIEKRLVSIVTASAEAVYDGNYLSRVTPHSVEGLVDGHRVECGEYYTSIVTVCTRTNEVEYIVLDERGVNVTSNYEFDYTYGELKITRLSLTVETSSGGGVYRGYAYYNQAYSFASGTHLAQGDTLRVIGRTERTAFGEEDNVLDIVIVGQGGSDRTDCYDISYIYGKITVTKRSVTLRPSNVSVMYDGTSHGGKNIEEDYSTLYDLADGHTASATVLGSRINVNTGNLTTLSIKDGSVVILDENGEDVTSNYDITYAHGTLEVYKRPITVKTGSGSKVYNGVALTASDFGKASSSRYWLIDGHQIRVTTIGSLTNVNFDTVYNYVDESLTEIISSLPDDGEGVRPIDNYDISYEYGTLTVTPRPIRIETATREWIYDGLEHTAAEQSHGASAAEYTPELWTTSELGLVSGHRFYVTAYSYAKDVLKNTKGEILTTGNVLLFEIVDGDGNIVSYNYKVEDTVDGTLKVKPRDVYVTTHSHEFIYDDTEKTYKYFDIENLASRHEAVVNGYTPLTDVAIVDNVLTVRILDEYGVDATSNYSIIYSFGKIEVKERPITVVTGSAEWVYDGYSHSFNEAYTDIGSRLELVAGHFYSPENDASITNVGHTLNTYGDGVVIYKRGEYGELIDVTDNYDIDYVLGTLTVTKRSVTMRPSNVSVMYDGTSHGGKYIEEDYSTLYDLADGHTASATVLGSRINVNTGNLTTLSIKDGSVVILDENGEDVTSNYDITYADGTLEVYKRPITVKTGSGSKVYDGVALKVYDFGKASSSRYWLIDGHQIRVTTIGSLTNVNFDTVYNYVDESLTEIISSLPDDGEGVRPIDNYDISYEYGTLTVTPRPIRVETATREWIYDGRWHTALEQSHGADEADYTAPLWIISELGLVLDHEFNVYEWTEMRDVFASIEDEYGNITDYASIYNRLKFTIVDSLGEDVSYNYDFDCNDSELGRLTVKHKIINVETNSDEWVYDGKWHSCTGLTHDPLADGDDMTIFGWAEIRDVADSGMKNSFARITVFNSDGEDMTGNYLIGEAVWGTLTVFKREIIITTDSAEKIYDGTPLTKNSVTHKGVEGIFASGLAEGHIIKPDNTGTITNAGSTPNTWGAGAVIYFYDELGDYIDATENYEITYISGTLTVHPRPVALKPVDVKVVYNGVEQYGGQIQVYLNEDEGYKYGILPSHELGGTVLGGRIDVGTSVLTIKEGSVSIVDELGANMLANYDITLLEGKITVEKRPVVIVTGSEWKYYDGTILTNGKYSVSDTQGLGLAKGQLVYTKTYAQITNKGIIDNTVYYGEDGKLSDTYIYYILENEDGEAEEYDVTGNYEIKYEFGKLEIKPRPITVTTPGGKWIYDRSEHISVDGYTVETTLEGEALIEALGHYEIITDWTVALDSGTYFNEFEIEIYDEDDEDVTYNYSISYKKGTLEITPRPITVVTESAIFPFKGQAYSAKDMDEAILIKEVLAGEGIKGEIALVSDEIYVSPFFTEYPTIIYPGEIDNAFDVIIIEYRNYDPRADEYELVDVTYNYSISFDYGKIKVVPREVVIRPMDSLVYNGKEQKSNNYVKDESSPNNLISNHSIVFETTAAMTKVGKTANSIVGEIRVYNEYGQDITEYYNVGWVEGELEITKRPIGIVTPDKEKIYDGKPLEDKRYNISSEEGMLEIASGDTLLVVVSGSRTLVGQSKNSFTYSIQNALGEDVTFCYDDSGNKEGTLTVKPYATIVVKTADAWKYYDGTPLTASDYDTWFGEEDGKLLPGHRLEIKVIGSQTQIGYSENGVEILLIDDYGNRLNLEDYYKVNKKLGKLTVKGEYEEPEETPKTVVYSVEADKSGPLYLKLESYGYYIGNGYIPFGSCAEYGKRIDGTHSAAYLASLSFKNSGLVTEKISIMVKNETYALPYYASFDDPANVQSSDVNIEGNIGANKVYGVNIYRPLDSVDLIGIPDELATYEEQYRWFVYKNYLDVPQSTRSYLEGIIDSQGFDPTDPTIVEKVVQYFIDSGIEYDLNYNDNLDKESDVVRSFLEHYKSGVCRHFAAAATLLFRTMGVPSRFVTGYYAYTEAGEWVDVTTDNGHAWVEVYVDGTGWLMAEVTPPSEDNPANGGGDNGGGIPGGNGGGIPGVGPGPIKAPSNLQTSKPVIEVQPVFLEKLYDGSPLYAKNPTYINESGNTVMNIKGSEVFEYLEGNQVFYDFINGSSHGRVYIEIEGKQNGVGIGTSVIKEIRLYNHNGSKEKTGDFEIITKPGKLYVYDEDTPQIRIYLTEQRYSYNGRERSFSDYDFMELSKTAGIGDYELDINISLVGAGLIGSNEINNNIEQYITAYVDGELFDGRVVVDVYDGYEYQNGLYIPLRIDRRDLEITANSATLEYDENGDNTLYADGYTITKNKLASGDKETVKVSGMISGKGSAASRVQNCTIVNQYGMDVTYCYNIKVVDGILTVE